MTEVDRGVFSDGVTANTGCTSRRAKMGHDERELIGVFCVLVDSD